MPPLTLSNTKAETRSDGRVKINFHSNPQQLNQYFDRFQSFIGRHGGKECTPNPRKNSTAFIEKSEENATPSPRLNIAIHIVGSRGDVQPFIPIAQSLSQAPYNHRVRICTHPVFKDLVESNGVEFFSIGGDPEALMAYMVKNPGLLPSMKTLKAGEIRKRRKEMDEIIHGVWRSCIESGNGMGERTTAARTADVKDLFIADAIIANPPSMGHIHCAEKLGIPLHMVFTMPWSPTRSFHHPLAAMNSEDEGPKVANYLSFLAMELLTWQGLGDLINKFRTRTLRLDPISPMWGNQLIPRLRVPYTYLWSESLIPKPPDWGSHINIAGFSFLNLGKSYTPPIDLADFLKAGPPPIYVGFGSIVIDDPQALTRLIFDAVKLAGVRAIVSKGWGGVGAGTVPDDIYLVGNCPHDWLFQNVSAVVHHGGAGTTAAGIAAGRPTVIVPFFGDQPFWGQMIARAGAGPAPIPFKEMTAESLAASIIFALQPKVQIAVQEMAEVISTEDGAGVATEDVQTKMNATDLRCDICPSRVAYWKHKKTGTHLSAFAAVSLVHSGVLSPHDFQLIRHKRWYVDEGAEGPAIGAIASLTGLIMSVHIATSAFSSQLRSPPPVPLPKEILIPSESAPQDAPWPRFDIERMEQFALTMAEKSFRPGEKTILAKRTPTFRERQKAQWKAREEGTHGRAYYVTRASARYVGDLTKAGLKVPVAFFYNVANGFHNHPSYLWDGIQVRQRDEIVDLGTGLKAAGKGFVVELYDGVTGIVTRPYNGAKAQGPIGFGKGVAHACVGLVDNIGAAVFGLPGYTLKGIQKELSKRQLTKLAAEITLVRLRQGVYDLRNSTEAEREEVMARWRQLNGT